MEELPIEQRSAAVVAGSERSRLDQRSPLSPATAAASYRALSNGEQHFARKQTKALPVHEVTC